MIIAEWEGNILLDAQKEIRGNSYGKIRHVCLTITSGTTDEIKPLEAITANDLRQTASIIGKFVLADRKRKFKNRRETTNLIIIDRTDHRMEYIKWLLQDCPTSIRDQGKFQM